MSLIGTRLGNIRVVDSLGQGGMGEVYLGYDETLKRRVALKAIRDEQRLDAEAKARFLREARILSQLDHPCICRIYEFIEGKDSDFLVLELISGSSLRKVMASGLTHAHKLYVAEMVAEALTAAHAKGVAHRDLKPENVMLTTEGEVKVLDFGLAFPVDESPVDASLTASMTRLPRSIPVEDSEANDTEDDGTSSEVLSATVVADLDVFPPAPRELPSIKTVRPPANDDAFVETERGTVMGTVSYMSPEQARGERVSVASDVYSFGLLLQELFTGRPPYEPGLKLVPLLIKAGEGETLPMTGADPDLAALVNRMKSLAPEARPVAAGIAEELRRVRDKPKRRLRRLAVAAVAAVLVLGALKYTIDLRRERTAAVRAREVAEQASEESEAARRESDEVSKFLLGLFAVSDPQQGAGSSVTAREMLDAGAARIRTELAGQPISQSRLMVTMGRAYRKLGLYEQALPLLEEALVIRRDNLGYDHPEIVFYLDQLASLYHDLADYERAEKMYLSAYEVASKLLGPRHPDVAACLNNLAFHYQSRGDDERAESYYMQAMDVQRQVFGDAHPDVARTLGNLGLINRSRGNYERAELYLRRAVEIQEELFGLEHPALVIPLNNLAMVYHQQGSIERAEPLYERALALAEGSLGPEHPDVAGILNNLAELHRVTGRYGLAKLLYRRAIAVREKVLGPSHPEIADLLGNLADLLGAIGDDLQATALYQRALEIQEKAFGPRHISVAIALAGLADGYTRMGRFRDAEELFQRARSILEEAVAEHPESRPGTHRLAATLVGQGRLYHGMGSTTRASESWSRAARLMEPLTRSSGVAAFLDTHSLALLHLGRVDEARPMVVELLSRGWSRPEFLELCQRHGLAPVLGTSASAAGLTRIGELPRG